MYHIISTKLHERKFWMTGLDSYEPQITFCYSIIIDECFSCFFFSSLSFFSGYLSLQHFQVKEIWMPLPRSSARRTRSVSGACGPPAAGGGKGIVTVAPLSTAVENGGWGRENE